MRTLIAVSALALVSATAALPSSRDGYQSQVAKTKTLTARLAYKKSDYHYSDVSVTITRVDGRSFKFMLRPVGPLQRIEPGGWYRDRRSIYIRHLDNLSEPEVVVDLYTGGAHCCFYSTVFRYERLTRRYLRISQLWGDFLPLAKDLNGDGTLEFLGGDDRFAYAFTDYASSVLPIQIWHFASGRFRVVTRSFPNEVRRSSEGHWAEYKPHAKGRTVRGILAAYLAEKYLLGEEVQGWAALREVAARGDLDPQIGDQPDDSASIYLANLRAFLARYGYTH